MKVDAILTDSGGAEVFLTAEDLELLEGATLNHAGCAELYQQIAWGRRRLAQSMGLANYGIPPDHTTTDQKAQP